MTKNVIDITGREEVMKKQPHSDEEAAQLLKEWKELHRAPNRRTKAWRARRDDLLPKMRAQIEWENW